MGLKQTSIWKLKVESWKLLQLIKKQRLKRGWKMCQKQTSIWYLVFTCSCTVLDSARTKSTRKRVKFRSSGFPARRSGRWWDSSFSTLPSPSCPSSSSLPLEEMSGVEWQKLTIWLQLWIQLWMQLRTQLRAQLELDLFIKSSVPLSTFPVTPSSYWQKLQKVYPLKDFIMGKKFITKSPNVKIFFTRYLICYYLKI